MFPWNIYGIVTILESGWGESPNKSKPLPAGLVAMIRSTKHVSKHACANYLKLHKCGIVCKKLLCFEFSCGQRPKGYMDTHRMNKTIKQEIKCMLEQSKQSDRTKTNAQEND